MTDIAASHPPTPAAPAFCQRQDQRQWRVRRAVPEWELPIPRKTPDGM
jgi:hypothetical protein